MTAIRPSSVARDLRDAGPGRAGVQRGQRGTGGPVGEPGRRMAPDPAGNLLGAADHQPLVLVAVGHHDPEDLQHGVRIVRVPAAGAEPDVAEDLAVVKRQRGERLGAGHEIVERAVVPAGHEIVPQRLQRPDVAGPDRVLDGGVAHILQSLCPCVSHLGEQRGKVVQRARVVRDALKVDDRAAGRLGQRVGERPGLQAQHVDVVVEGPRRLRKPHPAQLRDHAVGSLKLLRTQPAAHPRSLVDHRLEAEPHQLVRRDQPGDASADDSDLFAMTSGRIDPRPAGCALQSSNGNGKSGPNIVTRPVSPPRASRLRSFIIKAPNASGRCLLREDTQDLAIPSMRISSAARFRLTTLAGARGRTGWPP